MVFLKKKIQRKVKCTENSLSRQLVELELKVDKLFLKFLKHEEKYVFQLGGLNFGFSSEFTVLLVFGSTHPCLFLFLFISFLGT